MAKKKYYVVWEGNVPGVYSTWPEAQRQVQGFKNARFKSFGSKIEADIAFKNPEKFQGESKNKKGYHYVVWAGHSPGIYSDWEEARKQLTGFKGSKYKTFGSLQLAKKAFEEGPENYQGSYKKTRNLSEEELSKIGSPIEMSLSVDAACNGKGDMEYQGVWTFNKENVLFRMGPFKKGSNNIGEFLALVHALAHLKNERDEKLHIMPIYSDSRIAMGWVKAKRCRTKKSPSPELKQLIQRAEKWLENNTFQNQILKWETKAWGEIPADFGRK